VLDAETATGRSAFTQAESGCDRLRLAAEDRVRMDHDDRLARPVTQGWQDRLLGGLRLLQPLWQAATVVTECHKALFSGLLFGGKESRMDMKVSSRYSSRSWKTKATSDIGRGSESAS
jgi:hypothetical protein